MLQSLKLVPLVLHSLLLRASSVIATSIEASCVTATSIEASSVTATSIEAVKAGEEKRQIEQFPRQRMTNAELRDR